MDKPKTNWKKKAHAWKETALVNAKNAGYWRARAEELEAKNHEMAMLLLATLITESGTDNIELAEVIKTALEETVNED